MIRRVGKNRDYRTINSAYLLADAGDILWIDEGVYTESILMTANKYVHLIGNTLSPHLGKVVINSPTSDTSLTINNSSITVDIVIEGICLVSNDTGTSLIRMDYCPNINLIFNRCILHAPLRYYIIYFVNTTSCYGVTFQNCKVKWLEALAGGSFQQFTYNGPNVKFEILKSILCGNVENIPVAHITIPGLYGDNLLSISNTTTVGATNFSYLFDKNITTYTNWSGFNDYFTIDTDFGADNSKTIKTIRIYQRSPTDIDSLELFASNDNVEWNTLYSHTELFSNHYITLSNTESFRYYRLKVFCAFSSSSLYEYALYDGTGPLPFDYMVSLDKSLYGPFYGNYQIEMPKQYYFKGKVTDTISANKIVNSVTFNPYDIDSTLTLSNSNLSIASSTTTSDLHKGARTTLGRKKGKWYWEIVLNNSMGIHTKSRCGIGDTSVSLNQGLGSDSNGWAYEYYSGKFIHGNIEIKTGPSCSNSDRVGIAYDAYNGKIWWSKNGVWLLDGDPETGVNPIFDNLNGSLFPMISLYTVFSVKSEATLVFDKSSFLHAIPNGYSFYGSNIIWLIKLFNAESYDFVNYSFSDPEDNSFFIDTTYSGSHLIVCEDAEEDPQYNDLVLGPVIPKEYI